MAPPPPPTPVLRPMALGVESPPDGPRSDADVLVAKVIKVLRILNVFSEARYKKICRRREDLQLRRQDVRRELFPVSEEENLVDEMSEFEMSVLRLPPTIVGRKRGRSLGEESSLEDRSAVPLRKSKRQLVHRF